MRKAVLITGLFLAGLVFITNPSSAKAQENSPEPTPAAEQVVVEVVKGDSLSKIANQHQTTYVRMFNANEVVKNPDVIHPGEKLRVPTAEEELPSRPLPGAAAPAAKPATQPKAKRRTVNQPKLPQAAAVASGSVWDQLAACESGGNWSINTSNGYYGGLQFSAATWRAVGGQGLPHQNSREEQINRGKILQARSGWGQWPACTSRLGLR